MNATHADLISKGYVYNAATRSWEKPERSPLSVYSCNICGWPHQKGKECSQVVAARLQAAVAQSPVRDEPLDSPKLPGCGQKRIGVRVCQFTRRRQDPDNCCPKYELDWLRSEGLLPDDTDDDIALTIVQVQVTKAEDEGVLIEVLQ